MRRTGVLLAVLAVIAAGCETPVEPRAASGPGLEPDGVSAAASLVSGPVVAKAAGTLYRFVPNADGSVTTVQMHVNATKHEDGTARGSYRYSAGSAAIEVDVTCMTVVDGNRAWIAGVIRESTVGFIGHVSYFYTFDNRGGEQGDADIVSLVRVEVQPGLGEAQRFCDELPAILPPRVVDQGKVTVHG